MPESFRTPGIIEGKPALIVIDFQYDFYFPGSPVECVSIKDAVRNSKILIDKAREAKIPVIFTQEFHRNPAYYGMYDFGRECDGDDPIHTVRGTKGFQLVEELLPLAPTDYLLLKPRYSAFFDTYLDLILRSRKVNTLIIVGVCSNIAVHYTFVDAHQMDYYVRVVEECVAGTNSSSHEAALKQMNYLQHEAVQPLDKVLQELDHYIITCNQ